MPRHVDPATETHLREQVDDLADEFPGFVSRETVERVVAQSVESLGAVRFDDYIPVLAYRFSRDRLVATGQAEGRHVKEVPEALFVCVENTGRSQMAAALLDHRAKGRVHVRSAGTGPADQINPNVVEAMSELGSSPSQ